MRKLHIPIFLAFVTAFAIGCGDSIIGEPVSNQPPNTEVSAAPPVLSQTEFTVEFFWDGTDKDSEIRGFEWRISNNGADGVIDIADTTGLPWHFTQATDSLFVVSAELDSFELDIDVSDDPDDYRFWQTHTFFIRAVDEEGKRDPTPANVSFTATTLAPTIVIDVPTAPSSNSCVSSAKVLTFGWVGRDPDNPEGDPKEVRYLLKRIGGIEQPCLTQVEFERTSPIRSDDPDWSDWVAYDAPEDSGLTVTLPKQELGDSFLFAVQARDLAGAVTPTFVWNRNVRHVRIGDSKFPTLIVSERFLGTETFRSTNRVVDFDIVEGQELIFEWNANATEYAGVIEAFRYGWDVNDPNDPNDPGWAVAWGTGPNWRRAQPQTFLQGSHNFVVQCRDNSGTISRGIYQLQVIQIANRADQRSLLLIDDWRDAGSQAEAREAVWDRRWSQYLQSVRGFTPSDIIDAQRESDRLRFATVNGYKSVVWFTNASVSSYFHREFAPIGLRSPRFNWLEVYQGQVGNLLLAGPGSAYNSFERVAGGDSWIFPVIFNVSAIPPNGFGLEERPDGTEFNRGTTRYPYSAWCVETVDVVRPNLLQIYDEQGGRRLRTRGCSGIYRARVAPDFYEEFGDATDQVLDLVPIPDRKTDEPGYTFEFEEWYNKNVTSRSVSLVIRDCQIPMYRAEARADAQDPEPDPLTGEEGVYVISNLELRNCGYDDGRNFNRQTAPEGATASPVTGATIGLASQVYSDEKQLVGSEDFLWGFNPMGFEDEQVASALRWIIRNRWDIAVQ